MYCLKCGNEIDEGINYCPNCGMNLSVKTDVQLTLQKQTSGKNIAALVLGLIGIFAWLIPIIGLPIGIVGLVMGIMGMKRCGKGMAIAGIVLSVLCLVLTIINASIGAYQGYHGTAWFQKTESSESTRENEFYLKDTDGNVIMSGGIGKAEAKKVVQSDGEEPVVEITFTDEGANKFAKITEEHIGDQVEIYINENKIAAPYVHTAITGGVCQIPMSSNEEAEKTAEQLNNTR